MSPPHTLHTYSDKMNQVLHFVAQQDTTGIAQLGMLTEIDAATVDKLIVKDGSGTHTSPEDVDWASAEYVGFDICMTGSMCTTTATVPTPIHAWRI